MSESMLLQLDEGSLTKQLLRAQYSELVAKALVRAAKLDDKVKLSDLQADEERSFYRQIAQAAVMLACDKQLRRAADYYAAEAFQLEEGKEPLNRLGLVKRVHKVSSIRAAINAWLRFLRGEYPLTMPQYKRLAQSDMDQVAAIRRKQP